MVDNSTWLVKVQTQLTEVDTYRIMPKILALTVLKTGAGEIVRTVQIVMMAGLPYTALRHPIRIHPTLLEGVIPLFTAVPPRKAVANTISSSVK